MRRFLKFAHEVGGVGLMGAVLAHMVLSYRAEGLPPVEYSAMRQAILAIAEYLLVPSLLLVLFSGLVAMALHRGFHNAGWAWVKLATTAVILEGTLLGVTAPATTGAEVAAEIAAGDTTNTAMLDDIVRHERGGLWVVLFLAIVNIAFAVWRPRLRRRRAASEAAAASAT
jgi:hypothetical protein